MLIRIRAFVVSGRRIAARQAKIHKLLGEAAGDTEPLIHNPPLLGLD